MKGLETAVYHDFDEPGVVCAWERLLPMGTHTVFQTRAWQRTWWQVFAGDALHLAIAYRDREPVALAPLYEHGGMLFFVASTGSDYLDFIGDASDQDVVASLLSAAASRVSGFQGIVLYQLPATSQTPGLLAAAAERLGLRFCDQGSLPAPMLSGGPCALQAAAGRTSLMRHTRGLQREGRLVFRRAVSDCDGLSMLDAFFEQHVRRWDETEFPSLFNDERNRRFYRELLLCPDAEPWLRFHALTLDGRPVAFHFGMSYAGRFLWYKPSFEIELARKSPGEALLRHLLLEATDEGCEVFDFGIGDEAFKHRFANEVPEVRTLGLYSGGALS